MTNESNPLAGHIMISKSHQARRPIGQRVRVSAVGERFHGTRGIVCAHVPAFGTVLYRVAAESINEYGETREMPGWAGLFFPDQLRATA